MKSEPDLRQFFQGQRRVDAQRVPVFRPVTRAEAPTIAWLRLAVAAAVMLVAVAFLVRHRPRTTPVVDASRWAALTRWSAATDPLLSSAFPTPWDSSTGFGAGADTNTTTTTERSTL